MLCIYLKVFILLAFHYWTMWKNLAIPCGEAQIIFYCIWFAFCLRWGWQLSVMVSNVTPDDHVVGFVDKRWLLGVYSAPESPPSPSWDQTLYTRVWYLMYPLAIHWCFFSHVLTVVFLSFIIVLYSLLRKKPYYKLRHNYL